MGVRFLVREVPLLLEEQALVQGYLAYKKRPPT